MSINIGVHVPFELGFLLLFVCFLFWICTQEWNCWVIWYSGIWQCWIRPLKVPWTARKSKESVVKKINSEYLLERLRLTVKLQYFDNLMQRANPLEKTLMLGKMEGRRRRGGRGWDGWTASLTRCTWTWANSRRGEGQGSLACCIPRRHRGSGRTVTERKKVVLFLTF